MGSRLKDIAALRMLLTSGIDLMTQMPVVSEHLKRLVPSFSLSMIRVDEHCAPQEHYSEYFDEFSHRLFAESGHLFAAATDDPAAFGNLLRNPKPYGTLIDTRAEYLAGATYNHLFKRNGIHHVLDLALRDSGGPLGILGIFREEKARSFSKDDVAAVGQIYDLLVHACVARPLPARHDEIDSALIVARRDGVIEWASPQARRWLEDATGGPQRTLLTDHHTLPLACRQLCRQLAGAHKAGANDAPTLVLPVPGGRVRLRAYELASSTSTGEPPLVGIQLRLEMHRSLKVMHALALSDLPVQQRRIAFAYWSGLSSEQLARKLGVRAASLKSYRKELYSRLDVSGVDELTERLDADGDAVIVDLKRHRPR